MAESEFRRRIKINLSTGERIDFSPDGRKRNEIIGQILTKLRLKRGYTQDEISAAVGIARTTYASYERGRHEPSIDILIDLAEIYGVSMDFITGRYTVYEIIEDRIRDELIDRQSQEYEDSECSEHFELEEFREHIKGSKKKYNRVKTRKTIKRKNADS